MGVLMHKIERNMIKYTEEDIQIELEHYFSPNSVKYSMDGLYVFDWESDKLIKMRSGLIYEFEIKISKSDFKNDFKHKEDKHIILEGDYNKNKYIGDYYKILDRYKDGDKYKEWLKEKLSENPHYIVEGHKKPNFFYYVTPVSLLDVNDIPSYAGLIEVNEFGTFYTIKKAPQLHKVKYTDEELNLPEKFYYNMDNWRKKYHKLEETTEKYKSQLNEELKKENHETTYSELKEKYNKLQELYEKTKKNCDIYYEMTLSTTNNLMDEQNLTRKLAMKIKEYDKNFDLLKFIDNNQ